MEGTSSTTRKNEKPNVFDSKLDEQAEMLNLSIDFLVAYNLRLVDVFRAAGSGSVYLLKDKSNKEFVLKAYSKDSNCQLNHFSNEATALKKLDHPHIIKPFLAVSWPSYFGLCLPFYPGGDLSERCSRMTLCDVIRCFTQVTDVMHYLHSLRIVHGDLKLENILVNEQNQAIVMDFGQARALGEKTMVDTWYGTMGCVAPEKERGKPMCPFKMDIWSLGVVLWELLTSRDNGLSKREITASFVKSGKLMKIDQPYRNLLERLFDLDPVSRASAQEIKDLLKTLLPLCPSSKCEHGISRPIACAKNIQNCNLCTIM